MAIHMQDYIAKHGIVSLGLIYFAFNLIHKKLINLVIFLTVLVLIHPQPDLFCLKL